jgi:membrane-bound lytic murein transglycosylase B
MKSAKLEKLGVPRGELGQMAKKLTRKATDAGLDRRAIDRLLGDVIADPVAHRSDPHFGQFARALHQRNLAQARIDGTPGGAV